MTDPCWLPSAIMQTVGAIISITVVVFTVVQKRFSEIFAAIMKEKKGYARVSFDFFLLGGVTIGLAILLGFITIYSSMLWLKCLTINVPLITLFGIPIDTLTEKSFICTVGLICIYSISMVAMYVLNILRLRNYSR